MGELTELALATITQAQRRVEVVGQNMANAATPAYKRQVPFSQLINSEDNSDALIPQINVTIDNRPGKIVETGAPSDLALSGPGFFAFRRDSDTVFARNGQLTIDGEGRLVNGQGYALQLANGSDLVVRTGKFTISIDGTVTDQGTSLGRIAVFAQVDDGTAETGIATTAADQSKFQPVDNVRIVQGAYESSNVTTGDEMVAMIEALRRAESGQRIMNVYDDLMGRVITAFGEGSR